MKKPGEFKAQQAQHRKAAQSYNLLRSKAEECTEETPSYVTYNGKRLELRPYSLQKEIALSGTYQLVGALVKITGKGICYAEISCYTDRAEVYPLKGQSFSCYLPDNCILAYAKILERNRNGK